MPQQKRQHDTTTEKRDTYVLELGYNGALFWGPSRPAIFGGFRLREYPLSETPSHDVTRLLTRWKRGDERALHELVAIVYDELRRLAHYHLQSERPDHTLSTALVHEAYVRLIGF